MLSVPRHEFVPTHERKDSYTDHPLPIGRGQTISQPYIVAYMTEQLLCEGSEKVLEVGTGSGYQAAVLSCVAQLVYSVEIKETLHIRARRVLSQLGYENVHCVLGDGSEGLPDFAQFDRVIITAAVSPFPPALAKQLVMGGAAIYPEGSPHGYQELVLLKKVSTGWERRELTPVRFVPMTGRAALH